jgi:hypothetical protein
MSKAAPAALFAAEGIVGPDELSAISTHLRDYPAALNSRRPAVLRPESGLGLTPLLMLALRRGDERAARLLYVEHGADCNLQDECGKTAAMLCVEFGHGDLTILEEMLEASVDGTAQGRVKGQALWM